ncbi:MAG: hypothetical protein SFV19_04330 [Rhodospirillaceae bacterium]|nr:hypothetical protein [Rhodospirillaceae bacterium]
MSTYDLITCNSGLVVDVCEDSAEAERVRVSRRKGGYSIISVIGCDHADVLDIKKGSYGKLAPTRVYHHGAHPWLVVSAHGDHPAKISLSMDEAG